MITESVHASVRVVDDTKVSPQSNSGGSPNATSTPDRAAANRRCELKRIEQERRRREAVSFAFIICYFNFHTTQFNFSFHNICSI